MEQETAISQSSLEKEEQSWRHHAFWFQTTAFKLQLTVEQEYKLGRSPSTNIFFNSKFYSTI